MGHGAWGMGHGAWGMGHGALERDKEETCSIFLACLPCLPHPPHLPSPQSLLLKAKAFHKAAVNPIFVTPQ